MRNAVNDTLADLLTGGDAEGFRGGVAGGLKIDGGRGGSGPEDGMGGGTGIEGISNLLFAVGGGGTGAGEIGGTEIGEQSRAAPEKGIVEITNGERPIG